MHTKVFWVPDSWYEEAAELQKIPLEELDYADKYKIAGIILWELSAPFLAAGAAFMAYEHYTASRQKALTSKE
jgi:hypothetical protein